MNVIKKIPFLIGFTFILLLFSISNVKAVNYEESIEVDVLPTCDLSNINTIYLLSTDMHYYKCIEISGSLRNIQVGDILNGKTLYLTFPDDLYNQLGTTNIFFIRLITGSSSASILSDSSTNSYGIRSKRIVITFNHPSAVVLYQEDAPLWDFINLEEYTIDSSTFNSPVIAIDTSSPAYQYIKISASDTYKYEDLGEYTYHITYDHINKDFYLFYDFDTISQFDIFNNYDFTTFTDFQKLVITIGVNTFYLGFLGLCIYIFLKLMYKLLSWII